MYINKKIHVLYFSAVILLVQIFFTGCSSRSQANTEKNAGDNAEEYKYYADWAVNIEYVMPGCDGPECIHSIDKPKFIDVPEVTFLEDDELVVGLRIGNELKCYPHAILDWHEIINDELADQKIVVNYCPLTGSAMAWNRVINGEETTFGISGLLCNSNVIPYDRKTGSHWSQMKQQCVNGEFYKQKAETFQVIETNWKTWRTLYPHSKILSTETGYDRNYHEYPYHTYKEDEEIYFEVEFDNDSLFQKERMYGIVHNEDAKCYRFEKFKYGITVLNDSVFGKNIVVIGSEPENFIVAFENNLNGIQLDLKPVQNSLPAIVTDASGNMFDVFGYCTEGPQKGKRLQPVEGFIAYWFAWAAFYPEVALYSNI